MEKLTRAEIQKRLREHPWEPEELLGVKADERSA